MIDKILDSILLVGWIAIGITVLIGGTDRLSYACVWVCLLAELGLRLLKDFYDDDNDDKLGTA